MSMYKKVDTSLNFVEREKQIVDYWNANHVFEESMKAKEGGEEFSFYDGPPTANGKPHIGHILTRVMKDIVPRYQTMKGKHVLRNFILNSKILKFRKGEQIMKNRRNIIVAFLLCACLIVGVGYAALTDTLDINGTADVNQSAAEDAFNEDIYFSAAAVNGDAVTITYPNGSSITLVNTANVNTNNNDKASFTANTLRGAGDTASFTFTIKNDGDVDANVTPTLNASAGNTKPEYFDIESDWNGETKLLKAGEFLTYTVTITLKQTPTETISGSFHIELTAVSTQSANVDQGAGQD